MNELFQMWGAVEVLSLFGLPLTVAVFHNLPDRGWPLSKTISLAVLALSIWLPLMCFQSIPFSQPVVVSFFLVFMVCGVIGFLKTRQTIIKIMRVHLSYIVVSEVVFAGMVFLLGWLRSYGPEIRSFETFMDEGFLAALMRSTHFPPNDMWFSGYPINYYYYAHYTIALLAKLLNQSPSIAFNTGICIFFGLTATNLLSVTCNIVTWARLRREHAQQPQAIINLTLLRSVPYGGMTILMGLILGNLAATQQWWKQHEHGTLFNWFAPSRVVTNTINEFPAFSFLLSCFHAHVLTLAFTVVAVALALNLFFEQEGKGLGIFGRGWQLPLTLGMTALVLGGLYAMNGWDFPTYMGLILICIILQHWLVYGGRLSLELVLDICTASISLVVLALLLYIPFYFHFVSPSQGMELVAAHDRTELGQAFLIYGLFAFFFLSFLLVILIHRARRKQLLTTSLQPARRWLRAESAAVVFTFIVGVGILLTVPNSMTLVLTGCIAVLGIIAMCYGVRDRSIAFTLLLGSLAFGLIALCEVVFLKDVFTSRTNTVFKFYFQCWTLLAITCGAALAFLPIPFREIPVTIHLPSRILLHGIRSLWVVGGLILFLASAVYPLLGPYARYARFDVTTQQWSLQRTSSLDGLDYLRTCRPPSCAYDTSSDYAAIRWLNSHVSGDPIIVEAISGEVMSDSSGYGRIATFTGLPTVMGWMDHEYQWRVNWMNTSARVADFQHRKNAIDTIYTSPSPSLVLHELARYHVTYLYVGYLEKYRYPDADLQRFRAFLDIAYETDGATIYKIKGR